MILSSDLTLDNDITQQLLEHDTVIVMSGSKQCMNCQLTRQNIIQFLSSHITNSLSFISVDNSVNDLLESRYYQLNELDEYPKTVIYNGSINNVSFREGIITVEDLENYNTSES